MQYEGKAVRGGSGYVLGAKVAGKVVFEAGADVGGVGKENDGMAFGAADVMMDRGRVLGRWTLESVESGSGEACCFAVGGMQGSLRPSEV